MRDGDAFMILGVFGAAVIFGVIVILVCVSH